MSILFNKLPCVKLRLRGHPDDEVNSEGDKINKGKTKSVKNNGFNPVWNEMFVFESKVPSLAFLEFKVKDHCKSGTDEDIAMFSAPLSLIKEGTLQIKNLSPFNIGFLIANPLNFGLRAHRISFGN